MESLALGFDFSNFARNQTLAEKKIVPQFLKTGTTICAAIYDEGVVLGADTRATMGHIVGVKDEPKVHHITDNIYACGAGTAADNDHVTNLIGSKLRLYKMNTQLQPRVDQAVQLLQNHLFRYGGNIGAYLIVAGVDFNGPQIYNVNADGAVSKCKFTANGSGCYAAITVLETGWKRGMSVDECKELVAKAVDAGIHNDLGSGSSVNLCVINKECKAEFFYHYHDTIPRPFNIPHQIKIDPSDIVGEPTVVSRFATETPIEILDETPSN